MTEPNSRPSQCPACGCFEQCLHPGATGCAENLGPTNPTVEQAVEELAQAIYAADISADWQKPVDGYRTVAATLIAAGWTKSTPP